VCLWDNGEGFGREGRLKNTRKRWRWRVQDLRMLKEGSVQRRSHGNKWYASDEKL
jgi:hypothetical protein